MYIWPQGVACNSKLRFFTFLSLIGGTNLGWKNHKITWIVSDFHLVFFSQTYLLLFISLTCPLLIELSKTSVGSSTEVPSSNWRLLARWLSTYKVEELGSNNIWGGCWNQEGKINNRIEKCNKRQWKLPQLRLWLCLSLVQEGQFLKTSFLISKKKSYLACLSLRLDVQ